MTEDIIRRKSPDAESGSGTTFRPDELNADLQAGAIAKDLISKLPTPAIDTRKFTIIHGLMNSMNHKEPKGDDLGNLTYIDTSLIVELMDRVSEKSVNVDGWYIKSLFTYLNKPKVIVQGLGMTPTQEDKPGMIARIIGMFTGKGSSQEPSQ